MEVPIGAGFYNLEVVRDEAVVPLAALAYCPDHPQLVGAAPDRLLDVGIGYEDRVDVGVAVDDHRREPHWERDAGSQIVFTHLLGREHLQLVPAEVVDVEGRLLLRGAESIPVQAPSRENVLPVPVKSEKRLGVEELRVVFPVKIHADDRREVAPDVGDLGAAHPLAVHREVEGTAARPVSVVEGQAGLVKPNLQHPRLEGNLNAAPGQDQRALLPMVLAHLLAPLYWTIRSAKRSARAAIVRLGFGPTGPGITDPSAI